jgi:Sec-independent protein secretion pathway component TatC
MQRHARSNVPVVITSAPESPGQELQRRQRRYALSAAVFIGCFTAAGLLHRQTILALVLCGVSMVTLVLAVIGANIRKPPRRPDDPKLL